MNSNYSGSGAYWKYLINSDKRASLQLEQLCVGLASIIRQLDPGPTSEITPRGLAAFYRHVGGNYDSLLLHPSDHAVSYMYQILGCFHSLQPVSDPFTAPSIPCLTEAGFVRWQTLQLLLCPEEHSVFLQKAVQLWDVPKPDGGLFPKYIPREVFPDRPDEKMEKWHKEVNAMLNQKQYRNRVQNSPYQSPYLENADRREGYFANAGATHFRGPSRPSRSHSDEERERVQAMYARRSSVPNFPSPLPSPGDRRSHWDPANHSQRKARSHSEHRSAPWHMHHRSHTTSSASRGHRHAATSSSHSPSTRRPGRHSMEPVESGPSAQRYPHRYRSPARTPSTVDEGSGSEASSETSQRSRRSRRHRPSDGDGRSRQTSPWLSLPSFLTSHQRRHSSDASYRATPPAASRPEYYSSKPLKLQAAGQPYPPLYRPSGVPPSFREPNFDGDATISAPLTPVDPRARTGRYPDEPASRSGPSVEAGQPLTRDSSSGSGTDKGRYSSDWGGGVQRKSGMPTRLATVTGVGGRIYPSVEPTAVLERPRGHQPRGSMATAI